MERKEGRGGREERRRRRRCRNSRKSQLERKRERRGGGGGVGGGQLRGRTNDSGLRKREKEKRNKPTKGLSLKVRICAAVS